MSFPDDALGELKRRALATRWPDRELVADASQGVQLSTMKALARYWATDHDWRRWEAELNALPQFMTEIDGVQVHFIHVRSKHGNPLPVIITHGWPGSIIEQMKVIDPLANPTAHGASAADAFDVVVPSIPGHGFSGKPTTTGWDPVRIARASIVLIQRLGYTRFVAQGGDWHGQQAALGVDVIQLMDALQIRRAVIGGCDWGARTANIVAALWHERCKAMVSVSGYLIGSQAASRAPLPPKAEQAWWYQYYFATDRGQEGYQRNTREFSQLIWETASPQWRFDEATFDRSAASFDNPDHVAIVIHNYRLRLGLAAGEAQYDEFERRLAVAPGISVPTITLEGDANGAPLGDPAVYAKKFSGNYQHRTIAGGIGHNLPQEAPQAFLHAILDVDRF